MSVHAPPIATLSRSSNPHLDVINSERYFPYMLSRLFEFFSDLDTGTSTWSSGHSASLVAAVLTLLLFLYFQRSRSHSNKTTAVPSENKQQKRMAIKPNDGAVKVTGIFVHPIKSCRTTAVQTAKYTPEGLENDRMWSILNVALNTIITAREFPRMVLIHPTIKADPSVPHGGLLHVAFPEDSDCPSFSIPLQPTKEILSTWEILDQVKLFPQFDPVDGYVCQTLPEDAPAGGATPSSILSEYFGKPVHLIYKGPRARPAEPTAEFPNLKATAVYQDGYPLLVLSEESMAPVNEELRGRVGTQGIKETWKEEDVVIKRFRPNIVLGGGGPFAEDDWEEIKIGSQDSPRITLVSKCVRCLLPNVSPETGEADKAVPYKVLMKFRTGIDPIKKMGPCVGCHGVPDEEGVVNVGDVVYVKKVWGE